MTPTCAWNIRSSWLPTLPISAAKSCASAAPRRESLSPMAVSASALASGAAASCLVCTRCFTRRHVVDDESFGTGRLYGERHADCGGSADQCRFPRRTARADQRAGATGQWPQRRDTNEAGISTALSGQLQPDCAAVANACMAAHPSGIDAARSDRPTHLEYVDKQD